MEKGVGVCLCVCGWLKKKLLTSHQVALPRLEFSEHEETSVDGSFRKPLIFRPHPRVKEQCVRFKIREKWYFFCIVLFINAPIECVCLLAFCIE